MITLEFSLEVIGQEDASTVYFVSRLVVLFTDKMRFVASSFRNRDPSRLRYIHLRSRIEIVLGSPRFIVESATFNSF